MADQAAPDHGDRAPEQAVDPSSHPVDPSSHASADDPADPFAVDPRSHATVPGSEREPVVGAVPIGPADPTEQLLVSVLVRPRAGSDPGRLAAAHARTPIGQRRYLSRQELAQASGADQADLDAVAAFAADHGLDVVESSPARRTVRLAGSTAAMSAAFGVQLQRYQTGDVTYRGRQGAVQVPIALADVVQAVLGLDDRPQVQTRFRVAAQAAAASVTPVQLAQLYDFPTGFDGTGECIGIVELGGGYRSSDLTGYFQGLGLRAPTVVAVGVDGATNSPTGDSTGPDGEVLLDIEVAGAIAPGARIAVYFAPNTDAGFLDAITTALHDTSNAPSVISISWGAPESQWTAQAIRAMDDAFASAAQLGVTICVASGDNGSADRVEDGKAHADFPASSPNVLGCGGTVVELSGQVIGTESAWNGGDGGASGGGISDHFDLPDYQQNANVPRSINAGGRRGRGVPDVCGDADPASGYQVLVDGKRLVIGGTSAVAPLWSGLLALLNQAIGQPVGFLNPVLYSTLAATDALVDITDGDNRVDGLTGYDAAAGWDACTGLGRPNGTALLAGLTGA